MGSVKEQKSVVRIVPIVMHDGNTIGERNRKNNDSKKQNEESSSTSIERNTYRKINEFNEFSQLTNFNDDFIEIIAVAAENKNKNEEFKHEEKQEEYLSSKFHEPMKNINIQIQNSSKRKNPAKKESEPLDSKITVIKNDIKKKNKSLLPGRSTEGLCEIQTGYASSKKYKMYPEVKI